MWFDGSSHRLPTAVDVVGAALTVDALDLTVDALDLTDLTHLYLSFSNADGSSYGRAGSPDLDVDAVDLL